MRAVLIALLVAAVSPACADEEALQRAFVHAMQAQQAGDLARAEAIFRAMLEHTDSPRVKLELARTLFLQAKHEEAKRLFKEVSVQSDSLARAATSRCSCARSRSAPGTSSSA